MIIKNLKPDRIGEAIGQAPFRVWPVAIQHANGYEPAILHELDQNVCANEVPFRMPILDATACAMKLATGAAKPISR